MSNGGNAIRFCYDGWRTAEADKATAEAFDHDHRIGVVFQWPGEAERREGVIVSLDAAKQLHEALGVAIGKVDRGIGSGCVDAR